MMSQTYSAITYSISTVGCSATCWESGVAFGTSATQKYLGAGGSATREISLDTILANWDGINTFGLSSNYKNDNLLTFTTWEAGTVNITGFGSVAKIVE